MNRDTLNRYLGAILTTVRRRDEPTPTGILYAAFMATGCSHSDFQTVQTVLVSSGAPREWKYVNGQWGVIKRAPR